MDFQTDFQKNRDDDKMTTIKINLTFDEYSFSRVKPTSTQSAIAYANMSWVDKEVLIIPLPLNITDRWIEKHKTNGIYNISIESNMIFKKTIKKGANVGRVYLPNELIGIDCLIIDAPVLDNF